MLLIRLEEIFVFFRYFYPNEIIFNLLNTLQNVYGKNKLKESCCEWKIMKICYFLHLPFFSDIQNMDKKNENICNILIFLVTVN